MVQFPQSQDLRSMTRVNARLEGLFKYHIAYAIMGSGLNVSIASVTIKIRLSIPLFITFSRIIWKPQA